MGKLSQFFDKWFNGTLPVTLYVAVEDHDYINELGQRREHTYEITVDLVNALDLTIAPQDCTSFWRMNGRADVDCTSGVTE